MLWRSLVQLRALKNGNSFLSYVGITLSLGMGTAPGAGGL
jgi:hypothetical protein